MFLGVVFAGIVGAVYYLQTNRSSTPNENNLNNTHWKTLSGCASIYSDKTTPFTINYPSDLDIDTEAVKDCNVRFDNLPDSHNLTIPVKNSDLPIVQVDTNFKFIYYIKAEKSGDKTKYSLYQADSDKKQLTLLDTYTMSSSWDITNEDYPYEITPGGGQYILYNWFTKDPTTVTKSIGQYDRDFYLAAKVKTADNKLIYQSPCYLNFFSPEFSDFEISDDGKHFAFDCFFKELYIGDWKTVKKLPLPSPVKEVAHTMFKGNDRIWFMDMSDEREDCKAQSYSVDLNGQNLKDEGLTYACY